MPPLAHIPNRIRQYIPNGQQFVTLIKRHFIGLIYIYLIVAAAVAAAVVLVAAIAPGLLEGLSSEATTALSLTSLLLMALLVVVLMIVTNIYLHNVLIITDKETIQVLQRGAFQIKVSHLAHADIEDITAEQNGLLQTVFNYGTLHIETSGELKNFAFTYCPDPDYYARKVLEARQRFTENSGN